MKRKTFKLEIDLENDAFENIRGGVSEVLTQAMRKMHNQIVFGEVVSLFDSNGNKIGSYKIYKKRI